MPNNPQWNKEQIVAALPQYRHPFDDDCRTLFPATVQVSRETWHNAKAALEMMENRQILTYRQRVDHLPENSESLTNYLKSRTAMGLQREAEEAGFLIFGKIEVVVEMRGDVHEFTAKALGIKPFEWRELY